MKIYEIQEMLQKKHSEILTECEVFFAFSNKQFADNCTRGIDDAESKYYSLAGTGGYYPKENSEKLHKMLNEFYEYQTKYYSENVPMDDYIEYELANHECWYTGDWEEAFEPVKCSYPAVTLEDIHRVYKERSEAHE